ncbi:Receptor-type adenylate cyclase [Seminavis robusta]|uniref:Receptor-type adenylate cyclase n=1 Tax=Seminavis robusta TaxID=568900 RepID=A0A9N8E5Y3_9STRA|nr:Receptor-type adenylate cyclase [Seminavis robusta]|eukprot:Sro706_g190460.1 Receptor-type adenylate cyclase (474) ;mRNA; r:32206-33627
MGTSPSKSLEDINASDIAAYVGTLGNSFKAYEAAIIRSGITGSELAYLKGDSLLIQLETMGITNRLHKRKLACVCRKYVLDNGGINVSDRSVGFDDGDTCSTTTDSTDGLGTSSGRSTRLPRPPKLKYNRSFGDRSYASCGGSDDENNHNSKMSRAPKLRYNKSFGDRSHASYASDDDSSNYRAAPKTNYKLENMCVAQSAEALSLLIRMENQKRLLRQSDLPSGPPTEKAAIVLTDVQGSTALWESDPKAMREALNLHDEIIRQHRAEHGGYEVDTEGDAFTMAFHTAKDALSFALGLQAALRDAPWGDDILELEEAQECPVTQDRGLRVRVAIHMGPVYARTNAVTGRLEYTGDTMERARQVEAMASGGQILATRSTWEASEVAAQIKELGNDVVQVLCFQRKSRPGNVPNMMLNDSFRDMNSLAGIRHRSPNRRRSAEMEKPRRRRRSRSANRSLSMVVKATPNPQLSAC